MQTGIENLESSQAQSPVYGEQDRALVSIHGVFQSRQQSPVVGGRRSGHARSVDHSFELRVWEGRTRSQEKRNGMPIIHPQDTWQPLVGHAHTEVLEGAIYGVGANTLKLVRDDSDQAKA